MRDPDDRAGGGREGRQCEQRRHPDDQPQRDDQRQQTNGSSWCAPFEQQVEDDLLFVAGSQVRQDFAMS
jgi:hypothetical protein